MKNRKYRFLISSIDALGHINCALGFGQLLTSFGHKVTFTHRYYHKKQADERGFKFIPFDEAIFVDKPPSPYTAWFQRNSAKFCLDSLSTYSHWTDDDKENFASIVEACDYTSQALEKVFNQNKGEFDAFIGDFVIYYPAFYHSPFPMIKLLSMNPLPLYPKGAPRFSGLSVKEADKNAYDQFKVAYADAVSVYKERLYSWWKSYSVPLPGEDEWWFEQPQHLGFYHYPEQLDYDQDGLRRCDKWYRIDMSIRHTDATESDFTIPGSLIDLPGKLIYFSLGSLASANIQLMNTLIGYLADSAHRFIVSKGPHGDRIELPDNIWGLNHVNQLAVLEVVDLVITHGGNNTFVETIYAAKPIVVIPTFIDQLDNAQRAVDCGIGYRVDLCNLTKEKLLKTIDDALNNVEMASKIRAISNSMRSTKSRQKAVEIIENFLASKCES